MGTVGGGPKGMGGAKYLEYEDKFRSSITYLLWYFSYYSILFTIPIVKHFSEKYLVEKGLFCYGKIDNWQVERVLLKIN